MQSGRTLAWSEEQYCLRYNYAFDVLEKQVPFRPKHLEVLKRYYESGKISNVTVMTNPKDHAWIAFQKEEDAQNFVKEDPYIPNKVVESFEIKKCIFTKP